MLAVVRNSESIYAHIFKIRGNVAEYFLGLSKSLGIILEIVVPKIKDIAGILPSLNWFDVSSLLIFRMTLG